MDEVHELDPAPGRNAEASRRSAALPPLRALLRREFATSAGVARRPAGRQQRPAGHLELEGRAEARVDRPHPLQLLEILGVERGALRLAIGSALVLPIRPRAPVHAQPEQILHQCRRMGLEAPLRVSVLDTQDK